MKEISLKTDYKTMWKVECELNEQLKQQLEEANKSFNSLHKIMDRGQEENYKLKQQLESEFNRGILHEKERVKKEIEKLKRHDLAMYAFVVTLIE